MCCAASAVAEAWGPGGPKVLSQAEHNEAAIVLDLLITASMQVVPPDLPALAFVARTAALLEVSALVCECLTPACACSSGGRFAHLGVCSSQANLQPALSSGCCYPSARRTLALVCTAHFLADPHNYVSAALCHAASMPSPAQLLADHLLALQGVPKPYLVPEGSPYRTVVERCAALTAAAALSSRVHSRLSISSGVRLSSASWCRASASHLRRASDPSLSRLSEATHVS